MVVVLILGILALATFTSLFARIITSLCFFRRLAKIAFLMKKALGWLGYIGDEILQYPLMWNIISHHCKDPY